MAKLSPTIYAQALIESKKSGKKVAESFWKLLQKNKQYRELNKVLTQLDVEYAKANNTIIAEVTSAKELSKEELKEIENRIIKLCHSSAGWNPGSKILIHNSVKLDITGIVVKANGQIFDLSIESKISKLKNKLK